MALLRTFQLAKTFMPVESTTPLASLGQSLQDGIPLVIVTRGCFGREMDYGPGPSRNNMQKVVWETCRQIRAEMPHVLITCIDIPINVSSDVVQACMLEPLNEYRELMYHEGTWYAPAVVNSSSVARWKADTKREKLQKACSVGVAFNRKKFGWIDEANLFKDLWSLGWKVVLKKSEPPPVHRRTDLVFGASDAADVKPLGNIPPSAAEVTFGKLLARARQAGDAKEMLAQVKAYLDRAKYSETAGVEEAVAACGEAARLFEDGGEPAEASTARAVAVGACLWRNDTDRAFQLAQDMQSSASSPKLLVRAAKVVVDCHFAVADLDKALSAATAVKDSVQSKGDDSALVEAAALVVSCHLARGDFEAAIAEAKSVTSRSDRSAAARAWCLVAEAHTAQAGQLQSDVDRLASYDAAASAQSDARRLFLELGQKKDAAEAMQALCHTYLAQRKSSSVLETALEIEGICKESDDRALRLLAAGAAQLMAMAQLQQHETSGAFLAGGAESMVAAARGAVAAFEDLGDLARRAVAQRVLLQALRAAPSAS